MTESSPSSHPTESIEDFSHCHVGILKRLDMLSELPALLEPAIRAREIAVNSLEFFREVIFEHHLDEERELFPAVLESADKGEEFDRVHAITTRLTNEHRELEATWKRLESPLKKLAKGQVSHLDDAELLRLIEQYRAHAGYEETDFLPLAQTILGRNANHLAALGLSLHMRHTPTKRTTYI